MGTETDVQKLIKELAETGLSRPGSPRPLPLNRRRLQQRAQRRLLRQHHRARARNSEWWLAALSVCDVTAVTAFPRVCF